MSSLAQLPTSERKDRHDYFLHLNISVIDTFDTYIWGGGGGGGFFSLLKRGGGVFFFKFRGEKKGFCVGSF